MQKGLYLNNMETSSYERMHRGVQGYLAEVERLKGHQKLPEDDCRKIKQSLRHMIAPFNNLLETMENSMQQNDRLNKNSNDRLNKDSNKISALTRAPLEIQPP